MFGYTLIKIVLNTLGEDTIGFPIPWPMYVYMVDNEMCVIMSLGELIVEAGIRCPVVVRRQHFQTTSPQKPWNRFLPYLTYSIYRQGGTKNILFQSDKHTGCYCNFLLPWLIMGKNENWHLLLSQCRYFDKILTRMFLEWSSTKHVLL